MKYHKLGSSDLSVSEVCLGTMTFGRQNSEAEAHQQLDLAFAAGVNFLDAAEMYPIPTGPEWQGLTERYIGSWMAARGNRDQVIVATKVAGPGEMVSYLRPNLAHDRANITQAVEGSLERLQTDYIDLYQLHWPDRSTNYFGRLGYTHDDSHLGTPIEETLLVLKDLVDQGKVRHIGLSNETAWGTMSFLNAAKALSLPTVVSVQNPYSLLNRSAEVGLAEVLMREQVSLLPYSPLGFGVLTGKYEGKAWPDDGRLSLFPNYTRYLTETGKEATSAYIEVARAFGLTPTQLSLAFIARQPFVASTIIGATKLAQLEENIAAFDTELSDECVSAVEAVHRRFPYPCP